MAQLNFDATKVAPADTYEPLPPDWYQAVMVKSELKPTRSGSQLACQFKIINHPKYSDRVVFANITLQNTNSEDAQNMGKRQLSAIGHAVGVLNITNSELLHNKPLQIKVTVKPAVYQVEGDPKSGVKYAEGNEVKAFKEVEGKGVAAAKPQSATPGTKPASTAKPAAAAAKPAAAARPAAKPAPAPTPAPVEEEEAPVGDEPVAAGEENGAEDQPTGDAPKFPWEQEQ